MKRITLNYRHNPDSKPRVFTVENALPDGTLAITCRSLRGCPDAHYTLTPTEYGYVNQNGCEYVVVKRDTRKKPFAVTYRSGIGEGSTTTKFATLDEVRDYVKARWLGPEYVDGPNVFHGDYGHFYLMGCTLVDIGHVTNNYEWVWL